MRTGRGDGRLIAVELIAVILIGLLIVSHIYTGPNPQYDDARYIAQAREMAIGNFEGVLSNEFSYAFFEIVPYAISFYSFGYGYAQVVVPSLCEYVLLVLLAFFVAEKFLNRNYAVLAAFFTAITPFVVLNATRVLPDIFLGIFVAVAFYFYASMKDNKASYFALGIIISLSIYAKTEAFSFVGVFSVILLAKVVYSYAFQGKKRKSEKKFTISLFGSFVFGLLLGLSIYFLIYYFYYLGRAFFIFTHYATPIGNLYNSLLILDPIDNKSIDFTSVGLLFYFFVAGGAIAILRRKSTKLIDMFLVTFFFAMYLLFGSSSIFAYSRILAITRYFAAMIVPISVLSAYMIHEVSNKIFSITKKDYLKMLSIALLILVILAYDAVQIQYLWTVYSQKIANEAQIFNEAAIEIKTLSPTPARIYLITNTGFNTVSSEFLSFLFKYNSTYLTTYIPHGEFYPLDNFTCDYTGIRSQKYNAFLISINLNASNNTYVMEWLNGSCGLSFINRYENQSWFINVYKIYAKRST